MRTATPPRVNADGSMTHTVQRCCNGCGHEIGDVTFAEINACIAGRPLADVRGECAWCSPAADQAEFEADMAYLRSLAAAIEEHIWPRAGVDALREALAADSGYVHYDQRALLGAG